ncbi:MAG: plastocyanin/azurin family copper-binding protein [Amphiplicatus sp.]
MNCNRREMLAGALGVVVLSGGSARAGETHLVNIPQTKTAFVPDELTIKAGDTVRWRNRSIIEHSVVCDPTQPQKPENSALPDGAKPFDSGVFSDDATFEHAFTVPGTYVYFCREHELMGMVGKVIVTK